MTDEEREAAYISEVGRPPPLDESEMRWQWAYRGNEADREFLLDLIQQEAEQEAEQLSLC